MKNIKNTFITNTSDSEFVPKVSSFFFSFFLQYLLLLLILGWGWDGGFWYFVDKLVMWVGQMGDLWFMTMSVVAKEWTLWWQL